MEKHYIQLKEGNCLNCMRCIKACPVKAMTYKEHQPKIEENECVLCGQCYLVCNHSAKKVNSELSVVKNWLKNEEKVIISLAPSFLSVWQDFSYLKIRLLELGFFDIRETAEGAALVSQSYLKLIDEKNMKNIITTCCPSVVMYIEKEYPDLIDQIAPIVSPMIAHGYQLKKEHPDSKVVFLTPCIAKQKESNDPRFKGAIDATISIPELLNWIGDARQEPTKEGWNEFDGSISRAYPMSGGILKTLYQENKDYRFINVEGFDRVKVTLDAIKNNVLSGYFIEMSACIDTCLGGPLLSHCYHDKYKAVDLIFDHIEGKPTIDYANILEENKTKWQKMPITHPVFSDQEIDNVLWLMNKTSPDKLLDCGSCGYETCKEKAIAVLEGKADINLCLPNALESVKSISYQIIENTPNGIVVLNKECTVQEMNPSAKRMFKLEEVNTRGLPIQSILLGNELDAIFEKNEKISYYKKEYKEYGIIVDHAVIVLEDVYILILMDMTIDEAKENALRKIQQKTFDTAQSVINDQMRAVQEIASLLGETTAKSKIALTDLMKVIGEHEK